MMGWGGGCGGEMQWQGCQDETTPEKSQETHPEDPRGMRQEFNGAEFEAVVTKGLRKEWAEN